VRVVAAGDAMLSQAVTRRLLGTFARLGGPRGPTRDQVERLTARETEVLVLIARGRSNAEIASELVLAEQTVKTHVSRILARLELRDRTQGPSSPTRPGWCGPTGRATASRAARVPWSHGHPVTTARPGYGRRLGCGWVRRGGGGACWWPGWSWGPSAGP
jgi:DNA-binding CsgD family transcriptional regulator